MEKHPHGLFSWTDISVPDTDAAKSFYGGLFGWDAEDQFDPNGNYIYTMFRLHGEDAAGMGELAPAMVEQGAHVAWMSYVAVDDVDAIAEAVTQHGGTVFMSPMDVMTSGRMAIFQDPEGAVFAAWQAGDHPGGSVFKEHGSMTWNELATRDTEAARDFYGSVFPWEFELFGDDGEYWTIKTEGKVDGDADMDDDYNGGVMPMPAHMGPQVPAHWLVYFRVDNADEAAAKAGELGGAALAEPFDTPAGKIAMIRDNQGAVFAAIEAADA